MIDANKNDMNSADTNDNEQLIYFSSLLPWQHETWSQLTARYPRLPHGLLFAGMQGIGKREFVWHFTAWLLCDNREQSPNGACGYCQSCQWLKSGTHQDLMVLPLSSLPESADDASKLNTTSTPKNNKKAANKKSSKKATTSQSDAKKSLAKTTIKVDEIRELLPFISQGSQGRRVCVIDNADTMTIAAANALLKSLEEPRNGIHILLISDMPTKLLPTIKSRVQKVAIDQVNFDTVIDYLESVLKEQDVNQRGDFTFKNDEHLRQQINQALRLSNGAPLAALDMLTSPWYSFRKTWITVWLALKSGKRSSIAASDYWQNQLSLSEFTVLSETMLLDLLRHRLGTISLQTDINFDDYPSIAELNPDAIQDVLQKVNDIKIALAQNVQEKMAYDELMMALSLL